MSRCGLLACLILTASCGPKISTFVVEPLPGGSAHGAVSSTGGLAICRGDAIRMRWDLRGEAAMVLRTARAGHVIDEDEEEVDAGLLPDTLSVTLVASPGPMEVVRTTVVLVYPDSAADFVGFHTRLEGDTLVAAGNKEAPGAGRLRVADVRNDYEFALEVRHAERVALMDPASASEELAGTTLDGPWELRRVLSTAERANVSLLPNDLGINVSVTCDPQLP